MLLLLLAACGGDAGTGFNNQEDVEVSIFASLGSSTTNERLTSQGVPSDPETGQTGVASAELEVFRGDTQLFFNGGEVVDEAQGQAVTLTPDDSEVTLSLPAGAYTFSLRALR